MGLLHLKGFKADADPMLGSLEALMVNTVLIKGLTRLGAADCTLAWFSACSGGANTDDEGTSGVASGFSHQRH